MPRPRKKPPAVAPGGAYGTRQQTEQALQAVPVTNSPVVGAGTAVAPQGPPSAPQVGAMEAAAQHPPPQGVPLSAPSTTDEPFTAGLPVGAGAGPNPNGILSQATSAATLRDLITGLAAQAPASREIAQLADYVNSGRG